MSEEINAPDERETTIHGHIIELASGNAVWCGYEERGTIDKIPCVVVNLLRQPREGATVEMSLDDAGRTRTTFALSRDAARALLTLLACALEKRDAVTSAATPEAPQSE